MVKKKTGENDSSLEGKTNSSIVGTVDTEGKLQETKRMDITQVWRTLDGCTFFDYDDAVRHANELEKIKKGG